MRRTTVLLVGCVAFLAGAGLAAGGLVMPLWYGLVLLAVAWLSRQPVARVSLIIAAGLSLGLWRGAWYAHKVAAYQPLWHHQVDLMVQASDDGIYGVHSQLSFTADHVRTIGGQPLVGYLTVSGFGLNSIMQGDQIEVSGSLSPGLGAEQGRISYAKLKLLGHHPSPLADLRRRFTAGVLSSLPEPEASFAMGLLIGQRASLPAYVKQDLLRVGLTHIIAVSGYNLTIIVQAARRLLAGHSKRLSTLASLSLIGSFLLIAGNSASIVRAAIVSTLSMANHYFGRSLSPLSLLSLAAAITTWARPAYLWHDASWYLSFLAFYGVMIVAPIIAARLPSRWHKSVVFNVGLESVAAEIMSLPFILHSFGQISLIGLPANILVTSLVPLAMLLSFIAGLAGVLLNAWTGWLAWPARWLLTYMLQMAHWLAGLPHIFRQNLRFSTAQMVSCYGLIALLSLVLWYKTNPPKYVKLTDEITKEPN